MQQNILGPLLHPINIRFLQQCASCNNINIVVVLHILQNYKYAKKLQILKSDEEQNRVRGIHLMYSVPHIESLQLASAGLRFSKETRV